MEKIQPVGPVFQDFVSSDQAHAFSILVGFSGGDAETVTNFQSGPPGIQL